MAKKLSFVWIGGLAFALLFAVSQPVAACDDKPAKKPRASASKSSAKASANSSASVKVTFNNGSQEQTTERERRLRRECKGRVNAGACEGYAN
jgi:hypothetical protein